MTNTTQQARPHVLVSGSSFAGLTTAFWMNRLGYEVTVVEVGKALKKGGSPVDIKEGTVETENIEAAFQEYNSSLRPFVEEVQANAIDFGLEMFVPQTQEALDKRNAQFSGDSTSS
jgi:monoamine oxidase